MAQLRHGATDPTQSLVAVSGLGVLCAEAQADGVPCPELGMDCATCEHARLPRQELAPRLPDPGWPGPGRSLNAPRSGGADGGDGRHSVAPP